MRSPLLLASALCFVSLTAAPPAWADDASYDVVRGGKKESAPKHLALEVSPVGLLIGHYSAQVEILFARHSALTINPFYDHTVGMNWGMGSESGVTGFGAEAGYRYYTDRDRPSGAFFGPSLVGGAFRQTTVVSSRPFGLTGIAFDLGGQAVIGPGMVLGAGVGIQYNVSGLATAEHPSELANWLAGRGPLPRALLSFGYAI